jgi:ankyrin repeat protein
MRENEDFLSSFSNPYLEVQQDTVSLNTDNSNSVPTETGEHRGNQGLGPAHAKGYLSLFDPERPWLLAMLLSYRPGRSTLRTLLLKALKGGHYLPTLMILLETMNDPNLKRLRADLKRLFSLAIESENNPLLKLLLFYAPRPIVIDEKESNPLFNAAKKGNIDAISLMLAAGVSAESRGLDGATVLQTAAAEGQTELIKTLIEHGAEIDGPVAPGKFSALSAAIKGDHAEVVDLLLREGASPNPPYRSYGTPLQVAARTSLPLVARLVKAGANVNYPAPPRDTTVLQSAVKANKPEIVRYLLKHGADSMSPGSSRQAPLQMAIAAKHEEIAVLLRAAGCTFPAIPDHRRCRHSRSNHCFTRGTEANAILHAYTDRLPLYL